MTTHYKAVRPDGTDFHTGGIDYAAVMGTGAVITHPSSTVMVPNEPVTYLSVSVEPAATLTGGSWPCRLLLVEPVGEVLHGLSAFPHKRACLYLRVVGERPAHEALGPNGEHVAALIERIGLLVPAEVTALIAGWAARNAAWAAAWSAARQAARGAAWSAAREAAWAATGQAAGQAARAAAREAGWDAAGALVVRDLIPRHHYDALTMPWRRAVGPVHPDDPELQAT